MAFNGTEGNPISTVEAAAMTLAFRTLSLNGNIGGFIGREHIEDLLARPGSKGIRIYFGIDLLGGLKPILVSADASGNDDLGLIVDNSKTCPPTCGIANPLNS